MSSTAAGRLGDNGSVRKPNGKRDKYASRACSSCKRRKVKCSGEDACRECRNRDMTCRYSPPASGSAVRNRSSSLHPAHINSTTASSDFRLTSGTPHRLVVDDPRVDGLVDRVRALEQALDVLLKSSKPTEGLFRDQHLVGSIHSITVNEEDDDVPNQFDIGTSASDDVTLSSQVAAISALLSAPPTPKPFAHTSSVKHGLMIDLPDPHTLQHLIDVYFYEFDGFFPFLERSTTELRIQDVIRTLGYSSYNCTIMIPTEKLPTIALLCIMLAFSECLDPNSGMRDQDKKPGWNQYLQCRRVVQKLSDARPVPLDLVSAQALAACYLMQCEELASASRAIATVWQLATSARLIDQKAWRKDDPQDAMQKRRLWWTIYFLDRQISRRSGFAYHIRDAEFDVEDFSSHNNALVMGPMTLSDQISSDTGDYFQALINLARLWGTVWDTFFAVGRANKGDWMEVEIMDARILNTRRQLPKTLTWDTDELPNYVSMGESEPRIRRRIQIYTRLNLLRMLIRQSPVRQTTFAPEIAHMCSKLSGEIVKAHDLFISQHPNAQAAGYFITSSIVECIYHLAPVLQFSQDSSEHAACLSSFRRAHSILVRLSPSNKVAAKALNALNGLIRKWSSGSGLVGHEDCVQMDLAADETLASMPGHFSLPDGSDDQFGADGTGPDLGEWMDMSLGPLFNNGFTNELDFCMPA